MPPAGRRTRIKDQHAQTAFGEQHRRQTAGGPCPDNDDIDDFLPFATLPMSWRAKLQKARIRMPSLLFFGSLQAWFKLVYFRKSIAS